jgi:hypothetical protein
MGSRPSPQTWASMGDHLVPMGSPNRHEHDTLRQPTVSHFEVLLGDNGDVTCNGDSRPTWALCLMTLPISEWGIEHLPPGCSATTRCTYWHQCHSKPVRRWNTAYAPRSGRAGDASLLIHTRSNPIVCTLQTEIWLDSARGIHAQVPAPGSRIWISKFPEASSGAPRSPMDTGSQHSEGRCERTTLTLPTSLLRQGPVSVPWPACPSRNQAR